MGWSKSFQELERRLEGTFDGTYHPVDNVPLFRLQYPPAQEREALRQLRMLAARTEKKSPATQFVSLTDILRTAIQQLLGAKAEDLEEALQRLEQDAARHELRARLSDELPDEITELLVDRLKDLPRKSVAILVRTGSLYPFVRSSSLESRLEGKLKCAIVMAYPGMTLGELLDTTSQDSHGTHYRGDIIEWE